MNKIAEIYVAKQIKITSPYGRQPYVYIYEKNIVYHMNLKFRMNNNLKLLYKLMPN